MTIPFSAPTVDLATLRREISKEYAKVASNPELGFHFQTGRPQAAKLGYSEAFIDTIPTGAVESFAGTGNPFSAGDILPGEHVVDVDCCAGFDSFIAAHLVGPSGHVVGVDMTPEMLRKAREGASEAGTSHVEFKEGHAESLPIPDGWAEVVISNGVVNLCPDKLAVFREVYRVLKPGGRIQIGDILVQKAVPDSAKANIDLWTG